MKPLVLLLALSCPIVAQTLKPDQKNIDKCFKHSSKTPEAFDRCIKYEFDRVRIENRLAELRANDPPGTFHCDYSNTSSKNLSRCFDALMKKQEERTDRLYSTRGYVPSYSPYRYPSYYPRYYPRSYYPLYPRRHFFPLFPLVPLGTYRRY